jgi:nitroreductase
MESTNEFEMLAATIKRRRTLKSISSEASAYTLTPDQDAEMRSAIAETLEAARWAPFHFDRQKDGLAEPWRVHVLNQALCRKIAANFETWFGDLKPGNKIPGLLRGCGRLLLVNWLPQSIVEIPDETKRNEINLEHHAACAAFVQNILLLLTSLGYESYWSSGGQLASREMYRRLEIGPDEAFLAAIFVEPKIIWHENEERLPGKLRSNRSAPERWVKFVDSVID